MTLDINEYDSAFGNCVEFAQRRGNANDAKAIARMSGGGAKSSAAVTQHLVIDLTVGNPTVTDCKISPTLA